jgi:hypothetical protein
MLTEKMLWTAYKPKQSKKARGGDNHNPKRFYGVRFPF